MQVESIYSGYFSYKAGLLAQAHLRSLCEDRDMVLPALGVGLHLLLIITERGLAELLRLCSAEGPDRLR